MILHLLPESTWHAVRARETYVPESLETEGFVHCTGDDPTLLAVANRFYAEVAEPMVVLTLDESLLAAEVRWESPAHPDGRAPSGDEPLFPHVYGPLEIAAVAEVRTMQRDPAGRYLTIG